MPKMIFPKFTGQNPRIWKDECEDYFTLLEIPKAMWTTAAAMHMEDNAETWMHVYKPKYGLGSWKHSSMQYKPSLGLMIINMLLMTPGIAAT
jgi:hypothetical protein